MSGINPGGQVPSSEGQAPSGGTPPAVQPPVTPPAPAPGLTLEQALDALDKTRKSEAAMRQRVSRLDELEAKERAAQQAAMSLEEKFASLQAEKAASDALLQSVTVQHELERAAAQAGCLHPELVVSQVDLADLKTGKSGRIENAAELVEAVLARYPVLKSGAAAGGTTPGAPVAPAQGRTPAPTGGAPVNAPRSGGLTLQAIQAMTPAEYAKNHPAITQFYAEETQRRRAQHQNR